MARLDALSGLWTIKFPHLLSGFRVEPVDAKMHRDIDVVTAGERGKFIDPGDLALCGVHVFARDIGFLSEIILLPDERAGGGIDLQDGRMNFRGDGYFFGIFDLVRPGGGGRNIKLAVLIDGE